MIVNISNTNSNLPNVDEALEVLIKLIGHNQFDSVYFPSLKKEGFREDLQVYSTILDLQVNQVICTDEKCAEIFKKAINPVNIDDTLKRINKHSIE